MNCLGVPRLRQPGRALCYKSSLPATGNCGLCAAIPHVGEFTSLSAPLHKWRGEQIQVQNYLETLHTS